MAHNITQEDLNAVRQLMRVFRALEKFEPLIQKVLTIDEETGQQQAARNTALREREEIDAQNAAARQKHQSELKAMDEEKEIAMRAVTSEIEAERKRGRKELDEEAAGERKKLEEFRKRAAKESADHEREMAKKTSELQERAKQVDEYRRQESQLEKSIAKLAETRDRRKKEIGSLLESFKSAAEQGDI